MVRGIQVILDDELAEIYGIRTTLNQAVRRNFARFPADFAFQLTPGRDGHLEITICDLKIEDTVGGGTPRGRSPEHGALMAASVLSTSRAVEMSVFVVRAFVRLRDLTRRSRGARCKPGGARTQSDSHDEDLKTVFAALTAQSSARRKAPGRPIGFQSK